MSKLVLLRFGPISALGGALLSAGCSEPTTRGRRIEVATRIAGDVGRGESFENDFGWTIRLDAARIAFEHLYYVSGESMGTSRWWRGLVPNAFAHPGHYDAGDVLAEVNEHVEVELLGKPIRLNPREALTGEARSAVIAFGRLQDPVPSDAEGDVALEVEGSAISEDTAIEFRANVSSAELLNAASDLPEVAGCPFVGELSGSGTVHGEVLTRVWLDQVDFAGFDSGAVEPVAFPRGSEAQNAFVRGAKKALAYSFSFEGIIE